MQEQAIDRLRWAAFEDETDRKIVFIIGSGLSLPSVPSTAEMAKIFADHLGEAGRRILTRSTGTAAETYQAIAEELRTRRGDTQLARAVATGVLRAYVGPLSTDSFSAEGASVVADDWNLPPAQVALADFFSRLDERRRGPVFTTNFDPLTEAAFTGAGITHVPIAVPSNSAFPLDGLLHGVPIVHLHGYWSKRTTLSTVAHLNTPRPHVESTLLRHMQDATIVALGYGGWTDSFTRALGSLISDGALDALNSEVIWFDYGSEVEAAAHPFLSSLRGAPGVQVFYEVKDAAGLLRQASEGHLPAKASGGPRIGGWDVPPVTTRTYGAAHTSSIRAFIEGASPTWSDAAVAPMLEQTQLAIEHLRRLNGAAGDHLVALVGPTGEGKSLALRQVGLALQGDGGAVLLRMEGAKPIDHELVAAVRRESSRAVLLVDEADLQIDAVLSSLEMLPDGLPITWVIAMHDRYVSKLSLAASSDLIHTFTFAGISSEDANRIASMWVGSELMPSDQKVPEVAAMLRDRAGISPRSSLFGAVLDIWMGNDLLDRVADLLQKLSNTKVRGRDLRFALSLIALVQQRYDPDEALGEGLPITTLGYAFGLSSEDITMLVLAPLGREVGLSQIGNAIYVRHPEIARVIVENIRGSADYREFLTELGRVGGMMRVDPHTPSRASRHLYGLWRVLPNSERAAHALGLLKGAPGLLEARVSFLAAKRMEPRPEFASKFATQLSQHLGEFEDRSNSERGFWVEWAMTERAQGHLDLAADMLLTSLSDHPAGALDLPRFHYGMINLVRVRLQQRRSGAVELDRLAVASLRILAVMPKGQEKGIPRLEGVSTSSAQLVADFRRESLAASPGSHAAGRRFSTLLFLIEQQRIGS